MTNPTARKTLDERAAEIQSKFPKALSYRFKIAEEGVWFILVFVGTVLAQELLTFDANAVTDWKTWVAALLSASIRAAAGGYIAYRAKRALTSS